MKLFMPLGINFLQLLLFILMMLMNKCLKPYFGIKRPIGNMSMNVVFPLKVEREFILFLENLKKFILVCVWEKRKNVYCRPFWKSIILYFIKQRRAILI